MERLAAELIDKCGLGTMNAAHSASAIGGDANTFLTTDDETSKRSKCVSGFWITVDNPVAYVKVARK